jgi:hypothetical protein
MALKKMSYERVKEQHQRGFDIMTNGELTGGLAKLDATEYIKKAEPSWSRIQPKTEAAKQASSHSQRQVELTTTQFANRNTRCGITAAAPGSSKS